MNVLIFYGYEEHLNHLYIAIKNLAKIYSGTSKYLNNTSQLSMTNHNLINLNIEFYLRHYNDSIDKNYIGTFYIINNLN